jgi:hypothetical protein
MILQDNQSTFDLAIQLNGSLDNSVKTILAKYSIESFDEDLTGKVIAEEFDTTSSIVNAFYIVSRNVVTSDEMPIEFQNFSFYEYSIAFSHDFDSF